MISGHVDELLDRTTRPLDAYFFYDRAGAETKVEPGLPLPEISVGGIIEGGLTSPTSRDRDLTAIAIAIRSRPGKTQIEPVPSAQTPFIMVKQPMALGLRDKNILFPIVVVIENRNTPSQAGIGDPVSDRAIIKCAAIIQEKFTAITLGRYKTA